MVLLFLPIFYLSLFVIQFFNYYTLTCTAYATVDAISVVKGGSDRYLLEVFFSYRHEDQMIHVKRVLNTLSFRNPLAAQLKAAQMHEPKEIFYPPSRPLAAQWQRSFPRKALVEAVLVILISGYLLIFIHRLKGHLAALSSQ